MSGILSDDRGESKAQSVVDAVPESVFRILEVATEGDELEDGETVRAFLLVDIGQAVRYFLGRDSRTSNVAEKTVEKALEARSDEATVSTSPTQETRERQSGGTLSKLLLVGVVVGLAYLLKSRSGSVDEAVGKTTEQLHSVADKTAVRSGEVAQRTEAVVGQAAEGIQETGEMAADQVETGTEEAADRVRESGETAADQVQEGGQTAADQIDEAAETAEETQEQQGDEGEEASSEDDENDDEE
ncbi:hypothetical protein [Halomicrococcus sp. NG-SE-24]|uniref:hypothetical protein n=1 Tax=Halomicrococcus sp. NG-SE-24 TaxID=3436928 RepID=UPI003D95F60A